MSRHAKLAASAAHRWITCPGSIALSEQVPVEIRSVESPAAREGTSAHELAEKTARHRFLDGVAPDLSEWPEEMQPHIDTWCGVLADRLADHIDPLLLLELKVDPLVPQSGGTSDAVILSSELIDVIDFKYGRLRVDAEDNPQLRLYGLGALARQPRARRVRMTIVQPRLNHISSEELTPEELRAWRTETVLPAATSALSGHAPLVPSEDACRWCPAAGLCPAQASSALAEEFGEPVELMTGEELAELLPKINEFEQWAREAKARALALAEHGQLPGWTTTTGPSRRSFIDQPRAIEALVNEGFDLDEVTTRKLVSLSVLDKMTKGQLSDIVGDAMTRTTGSIKLVRDDVAGHPGPSM